MYPSSQKEHQFVWTQKSDKNESLKDRESTGQTLIGRIATAQCFGNLQQSKIIIASAWIELTMTG
jgi:hypothetical protein